MRIKYGTLTCQVYPLVNCCDTHKNSLVAQVDSYFIIHAFNSITMLKILLIRDKNQKIYIISKCRDKIVDHSTNLATVYTSSKRIPQ